MENLPDGSKNDKNAPFNQKSEKSCICGGLLTHFDSGEIKVNNVAVDWNSYKCIDCGEISSEEPDIY